MPDTITTYPTFAQNTPARASEMNDVLGNHRGNLLPINTDTASASNLTHNLGATDHRWLNGYIDKIFLGQTTTSWSIQDATTSVGNLNINLNGSNVVDISSSGISRTSLQAVNYTLSSNFSGGTTTSGTTTTYVTLFSLTLSANGGPTCIEFYPGAAGVLSGSITFRSISGGANLIYSYINYLRDGVTVGSKAFGSKSELPTIYKHLGLTGERFTAYDYVTSTGNVVWSAEFKYDATTNAAASISFSNIRAAVREII